MHDGGLTLSTHRHYTLPPASPATPSFLFLFQPPASTSGQVQHLKPTERELKKTMGLVMRVMRKLSANINSRVKVRCAVASLAARQRGSCPLATRVPTGQRAPQPIP